MTPTTITTKLLSCGFNIITIEKDDANKHAYVRFEKYDPKLTFYIKAKLDDYALTLYYHGIVLQVNLFDLNEINFFTENDQWYVEINSNFKQIKLTLY